MDLKLANVDTLNERTLGFEHTEGTLVCARILRVRWLIVVFVLSSKDFVASDTSDILTCQVIFKTVGGGNENPDSTNPKGMPTTAASCFANDVIVTSTGGICFEHEDRKRIHHDCVHRSESRWRNPQKVD